jgi:hypothetical protein
VSACSVIVVTCDGRRLARPSQPRGFSEAGTRRTLRAVCAAAGIDASGAVLVRRGEIAVYELTPPWILARIARSLDHLPCAKAEVAVARWLESAAFPAARLAGPADQPIVAAGRVVTFWAQVSEYQSYGPLAELGSLIRRLHKLDPPASPLVLPELRPFAGAESRIRTAELPAGDREFLLGRLEGLREGYAHLEFALPPGPIHGDANISSVLRSMWDGSPVLVDLNGFAVGPREWDLVLTALYFERFGWHTEEEYQQFIAGYGFDVMSWPGYSLLRDVRELIMLTWLAQNPRHLPEIDAEVGQRIAGLRGAE